MMEDTVCRKCGKGAQEIGGYLTRVNEKGVIGIWECRPSCAAIQTFEQNLLDALETSAKGEEK